MLRRLVPLLAILLSLNGNTIGRAFAGSREAQAKLYLTRVPTSREIASRDSHALHEPASGCYLGAFIDFDPTLKRPVIIDKSWPHQDPAGFEQIVQKSHAVYFFYMGYGRPLPLEWVRWLGAHGKYVHIALEPNSGLQMVKDDAYLRKLADDMKRSGAKIFLRYASEMNGEWVNYHFHPDEYRRKFKLVHDVMHQRAPNVALVWCPYMTPEVDIAKYWPGDDAVDWVGVNMYSVTYHNNTLKEPAEAEHPSDFRQLRVHALHPTQADDDLRVCRHALRRLRKPGSRRLCRPQNLHSVRRAAPLVSPREVHQLLRQQQYEVHAGRQQRLFPDQRPDRAWHLPQRHSLPLFSGPDFAGKRAAAIRRHSHAAANGRIAARNGGIVLLCPLARR